MPRESGIINPGEVDPQESILCNLNAVKLSIVFVNWNSSDYIRQCIESIYDNDPGIEREIIVVDNASPDRSVERLAADFKDIVLVKSSKNLGFARANNLGFKQTTGKYLLFLNPDTKLNSPAISRMLESIDFLSNPGVVGCRLLNSDLSVQTTSIQTFPTILNQVLDAEVLRRRWPNSSLWGIGPLFAANTTPAHVEVISGACMMVRRDIFEAVGMFSEDYFMYAEDIDLCYKAKLAGCRNYYVGSATVIHYGGGSSSPERATTWKWRSIMLYFTKNHGRLRALAFAAVMIFVAIGRLAVLALASWHRGKNTLQQDNYSASAKWHVILKTLLSSAIDFKGRQTSL